MKGAPARIDLVGALAALGHEHRLNAFRILAARGPAGLTAGAIAERLAIQPSALSFHLAHLQGSGLVQSWRAGRQVFYAANQTATDAFLRFLASDCCGGNPQRCGDLAHNLMSDREGPMASPRTFNVLFLCTANSARSIISESVLERLGAGKFNAFSAGSQPSGRVNPLAIDVLKAFEFPVDGLRSKSWEEFAGADAPNMDFVFTVCDNAAGEACPVWPGQPMTAHWGVPDPAAAEGDEIEKKRAFTEAFRMLRRRIEVFASLPVASLDQVSLQAKIRDIGRMDRAAG
jgi:ArsR family transcriptional regulator, arsenate/arsenite/antimonite-responsive transcriptional repressor / arsenate reductase (thioredoxin)